MTDEEFIARLELKLLFMLPENAPSRDTEFRNISHEKVFSENSHVCRLNFRSPDVDGILCQIIMGM